MDEVPLPQLPLLLLDDQERLTVEDEKVLLVSFPVVHRVRLARVEDDQIDAELREVRLGLELGLAGEADARLPGAVVPLRVPGV